MLILFYTKFVRTKFSFYDKLRIDDLSTILPNQVVITHDRNLLPLADAVVFNVPFLRRDLESDIKKPDNQIWVGWSYESEVNYPWMFSDMLTDLFDIWMTYHLDSSVVAPYYDYTLLQQLYISPPKKECDVCMFISSYVNKSRRLEYLSELMTYISIDSYGRWQRNCYLHEDIGYETKLDIIKKYRFVIAFENAISKDYVTEKFFEPLEVGTVPVYLGAPNIKQFSPGNNSFVDVRDYDSPKSLAEELRKYCQNESLYRSLFEWKEKPLKSELKKMIEDQKEHPFVRLAHLIRLLSMKKKNLLDSASGKSHAGNSILTDNKQTP